jgi:uncharacterized protein (DUF2147 family)
MKHSLALLALAAAPLAMAQTTPTQMGRWVTESGNLEVEVAPCGDAFCGTVVKVLANRSMSGPGEMAADSKPAMGMKILSDFRPAGTGEWKGEIYNRENGKTYSAIITTPVADQLVVHAYVGLPIFGKTQVWRRPAAQQSAK